MNPRVLKELYKGMNEHTDFYFTLNLEVSILILINVHASTLNSVFSKVLDKCKSGTRSLNRTDKIHYM